MPFGSFKGWKVAGNRVVPPKAKAKALVSKVPLNPIQKSQVKKMVMNLPEKKQYAAGGNGQSYYSGAGIAITPLTTVTQAIPDNGRIGDEITLTSLQLRMGFNAALGVGAAQSQMTRVVVFQFNAPGASAPLMSTSGGMFLNAAGAGAVNIYSAQNIDNSALYHILYDRTFELIGQNYAANANPSLTTKLNKFMKFYVPLKHAKKKIQYQAGSTNANNQIYLAVIGERPTAGAGLDPTYAYDYNIRYVDA